MTTALSSVTVTLTSSAESHCSFHIQCADQDPPLVIGEMTAAAVLSQSSLESLWSFLVGIQLCLLPYRCGKAEKQFQNFVSCLCSLSSRNFAWQNLGLKYNKIDVLTLIAKTPRTCSMGLFGPPNYSTAFLVHTFHRFLTKKHSCYLSTIVADTSKSVLIRSHLEAL